MNTHHARNAGKILAMAITDILIAGTTKGNDMASDTPLTDADCERVRKLVKDATGVDVTVTVVDGRFVITDPDGQDFDSGLVRLQ